jgi:hypothetical protein
MSKYSRTAPQEDNSLLSFMPKLSNVLTLKYLSSLSFSIMGLNFDSGSAVTEASQMERKDFAKLLFSMLDEINISRGLYILKNEENSSAKHVFIKNSPVDMSIAAKLTVLTFSVF